MYQSHIHEMVIEMNRRSFYAWPGAAGATGAARIVSSIEIYRFYLNRVLRYQKEQISLGIFRC